MQRYIVDSQSRLFYTGESHDSAAGFVGGPGHTRGAGKSFSEKIKQVSLRKTETAQKAQKATNSYQSFLVGYSLLKSGPQSLISKNPVGIP